MATETFTLTLDSIGTNISVDINDTSQTPGYNIAVGHSYSSAYTLSGVDRNGTVSGNNQPVNLNTFDTVNFNDLFNDSLLNLTFFKLGKNLLFVLLLA